ncbi:alpha/beta hydrolase [Roseisolibacter sp. H3M3-2]|uniref:alpha/beta fold hydrolase n=1 Tax=Roseisolibacter sp. H3M3-2 TaxID=3031323 RepID=UPI0023DB429E|nr:alpha/beta hydrolase [Roseisolibacter sp. H3M3-2]MDF1505227.1 alpha/beta hydrolase [Roseisolibacter sp. H3M3-2]
MTGPLLAPAGEDAFEVPFEVLTAAPGAGATPRERFLQHRRTAGRSPRLERRVVRVRGLDLAVWLSPAVPGVAPLCAVNGGLLFDHRSLWPTLAPLAVGRQVVLYDQRGRGESQPPPGLRAARLEHDAGDLQALREALGIPTWDLLGHSWGGGIAMLAAAQDPAVRRLVLADPVGVTGEWLPPLHAAAVERLAAQDPPAADRLAALDPAALAEADPERHADYAVAFYPAWFADPSLPALAPTTRAVSATGAAVAARLRREGYDWRDALRALSAPSLVVHGDRDLLPASQSGRTVAHLPGARLAVLADAGHMPFWEAPDRFFPLVDAFLSA